jgi:hypothetical protein
VREAVEATGNAALWLSGHVHWNTVTNMRGLPHITVQSASERFTTFPHGAAAFAMLEIKDGMFSLEVHGRDPFAVRMPFRRSGERPWMQALAPFTAREVAAEREAESA